MASTTEMVLPPRRTPSIWCMASTAPSMVLISTKAYPRDLPDSRSVGILMSITFPHAENSCSSSWVVTSQGRFPTKSLLDIRQVSMNMIRTTGGTPHDIR